MRPHFEQARAEAAVVVAYGLKIPDWLLALHPRGAINVHGSLLPAYRGAAPVNRAIINGDAETGRDDDAAGLAHGRRADADAAAHADRAGGDRGRGHRAPRRAGRGAARRDARRPGLGDRAAARAGRGARDLRPEAAQGGRPDRLDARRAGDREPRARRQPLAGRVHAPRRQAAEDLEGGDRGAAGGGPGATPSATGRARGRSSPHRCTTACSSPAAPARRSRCSTSRPRGRSR